MSKPLPEYVPITEVATRLGVNEATVRRWIRDGEERFGGVKLGSRIIVRRAPFEAFMRGADIPAPVIDLSTRRRTRTTRRRSS